MCFCLGDDGLRRGRALAVKEDELQEAAESKHWERVRTVWTVSGDGGMGGAQI